jgi:hypothetical protein
MLRRRLRARRLRRALAPAGGAALARLQEANRLLAEGRAAEAAAIFAELADQATSLGIPRSPQLHIQAGRAWMRAGKRTLGLDRLVLGLRTMAEMGQMARLPRATRRILAELQAQGMEDEASEIQARMLASLPGGALDSAEPPTPSPSRGRLPSKCPHCGGTVLADLVEWIDPLSAICDYCGSVLSAGR